MFLGLAKLAKKINPEIEVACLIADIPEYSTTNTLTGFKKMYHEYEVKKCDTLYGVVDKYVLLTKHMAERLGIKAPFIVMEGIATMPEAVMGDEATENLGKYILYTGLLNKKFGIPTLLDAFCQMADKSVKLILCGSGDAEDYIREKQAENPNIIFKGRVDRSEALALQKDATILVNPRQNNEDFTKYSFPSKNIEYLSSGVPVVAYKLDGIPDEYDDYIIYPTDDTPQSLCNEFFRLINMSADERRVMGESAKQFVYNNKNKNAQAKRIIEFLK
jgi:glycosyltransferase involved in cell wall biosynthesis